MNEPTITEKALELIEKYADHWWFDPDETIKDALEAANKTLDRLYKIRRIASDEIEKQGINANSAVKRLQHIYAVAGEST